MRAIFGVLLDQNFFYLIKCCIKFMNLLDIIYTSCIKFCIHRIGKISAFPHISFFCQDTNCRRNGSFKACDNF